MWLMHQTREKIWKLHEFLVLTAENLWLIRILIVCVFEDKFLNWLQRIFLKHFIQLIDSLGSKSILK